MQVARVSSPLCGVGSLVRLCFGYRARGARTHASDSKPTAREFYGNNSVPYTTLCVRQLLRSDSKQSLKLEPGVAVQARLLPEGEVEVRCLNLQTRAGREHQRSTAVASDPETFSSGSAQANKASTARASLDHCSQLDTPQYEDTLVRSRRGGQQVFNRNIPLCVAIREAPDYSEVVQLCNAHWDKLNVFHATAAIHRLGRTIGVKRSEANPRNAMDRPQRFHERLEFVQSELYAHLLSLAEQQRAKATREMICLLLWGMARLRDGTTKTNTPPIVQALAEELKLRMEWSAPFNGNQIQLTQATWALSQLMRQDAPWKDLFVVICQALQSSNKELEAGIASSTLKAAATYSVVHGNNPLKPEALNFLARSLLNPDSSGPQAISQGLYALAKLKHTPEQGVLQTLCYVLPTKVSANTIDRQAVTNAMWAMGELGFQPSNTLFRQMMQLVMIHSHNFLPSHFSQLFLALEAWQLLPPQEQLKTICSSIIRRLPLEPTQVQRQAWAPLADELAAIDAMQHKSGKGALPFVGECVELIRSITTTDNEDTWDVSHELHAVEASQRYDEATSPLDGKFRS